MPVIQYFPENEIPRRKGGIILSRVMINPGYNNLSDADYKLVTAHELWASNVSKNIFYVVPLEEGAKSPDTTTPEIFITDVTIKDLTDLITKERDLVVLNKWLAEETANKKRDQILNLINRQIKTITDGNL